METIFKQNFNKVIKEINSTKKDFICLKKLKKLKCLKKIKFPKTQKQYYQENRADPLLVNIAGMNGKSYGALMEKICREKFNLKKSKVSDYDHVFKFMNKNLKIEQKSARYSVNKLNWRWQHIEMKHHWDILLCLGLDFDCIKTYVITRNDVEKLIKKKIIKGQGKNGSPNQGYWFTKLEIEKKIDFNKYFTNITNKKQLLEFYNKYFI